MSDLGGEVEQQARRRLGKVLRGKYRLDRLLGVGGMAVVYKATHRNQAEFALKMLHPELSIHEAVRQRFLREGYAANSVKHSGAVLVVDDDVAEDGAAFLVMELLDGVEVESYVGTRGGRLSPQEAAGILYQLLDVLASAHAKGIVHRDIKPANLFLLRDGTLKVLDFGIARARDVAAGGSGANVTGTGVLLGTPAFMSPEQIVGTPAMVDGQADVWAAGATLFTLLTGRFVHDGETATQIMVRAGSSPAPAIRSVAPETPAAIATVVDRALAFDKAARWPTASAMRDALSAACVASLGTPPQKWAPAIPPPSVELAPPSTEARRPFGDAHPAGAVPSLAGVGYPSAPQEGTTTAHPGATRSGPSVSARWFAVPVLLALVVVGLAAVVVSQRAPRSAAVPTDDFSSASAPPSTARPSTPLVQASPPPAVATVVNRAPGAVPSSSAPLPAAPSATARTGAPRAPANPLDLKFK